MMCCAQQHGCAPRTKYTSCTAAAHQGYCIQASCAGTLVRRAPHHTYHPPPSHTAVHIRPSARCYPPLHGCCAVQHTPPIAVICHQGTHHQQHLQHHHTVLRSNLGHGCRSPCCCEYLLPKKFAHITKHQALHISTHCSSHLLATWLIQSMM